MGAGAYLIGMLGSEDKSYDGKRGPSGRPRDSLAAAHFQPSSTQ